MKKLISTKEDTAKNSPTNEIIQFAQLGKISSALIHDLINPLTSLSLIVNQKGNRIADFQNIIRPIRKTEKSFRDFMKVIRENIFTNEKKNGGMPINDTVEKIINMIRPRAKQANISISFFRSQEIYLDISPLSLYQIVINLLSNAVDAFEKVKDARKRHINITVEKSHKRIILTVCDNGCGIPKDLQEKIFSEYFTTKSGGSGIGLANIKDIVCAVYAGNIELYSTESEGSTLIISLPIGMVIEK